MPVLVVQKGHCYRTTGATGTTGEQQYATSVANACVNLLHGRGGWTVRAILADDPTSRYAGDAFVAIHCDGSTSASARGASVGYRNAAGQSFGQAWKRAYAARGWSGGFRPDNYTDALHYYYGTGNALSQGNSRAFIAECGFLTNAQDRALLTGPGGPTRVALAIGDALGINVPEEDNDMQPTDPVKDPGGGKWGWIWLNAQANAKAIRAHTEGTVIPQLAAIRTSVAAIANDPDIDPATLGRLIDDAVAAHTPTLEQTVAALIPELSHAIRDVMGEDNTNQADAIVDALVARLNNEGNSS
jgi:hypothetical protein